MVCAAFFIVEVKESRPALIRINKDFSVFTLFPKGIYPLEQNFNNTFAHLVLTYTSYLKKLFLYL